MVAKYVRVSTLSQQVARQLDEKSKLFIEKVSGKISFFERPIAKELIKEINDGNINEVTFHAVERIGRNSLDSLKVIDFMERKKIQVNISNLGLSLFLDNGRKNPMFVVAISVLSSIAENEKDTMEERQREGIKLAKIRGVYRGRKAGALQTKDQLIHRHSDIVKHLKLNKNSLREIAMLTGKSVNTVQKVKKILI